VLHNDFQAEDIPTISTVDRILKRNGLIIPGKRNRKVKPLHPFLPPSNAMKYGVPTLRGNLKWETRSIVTH
jgi:hypothetical protein